MASSDLSNFSSALGDDDEIAQSNDSSGNKGVRLEIISNRSNSSLEVAHGHRPHASLTNKCCNALCLFKAAVITSCIVFLLMVAIVSWFYVVTAPCLVTLQVNTSYNRCRVSYLFRGSVFALILIMVLFISWLGQKTYSDGNRTIRVSQPVSPFAIAIVICTGFVSMFPWLPVNLVPLGPVILGFVYTINRKDARMRMLVFVFAFPTFSLTAIAFSTAALALQNNAPFQSNGTDASQGPFTYNPWNYNASDVRTACLHAAAILASMVLGWFAGVAVRFASTFKSGVLLHPCTRKCCSACVCSEEYKNRIQIPKTYNQLLNDENLETFDILLDSETRYQASRMTQLFSRSAWTHAATIIKDPSVEVKNLYGIIEEEDNSERYFVFEAVRPQVRLTPLRQWMRRKAGNGADKRISAYVKLHFERNYADKDIVNKWLLEKHGTKFVTDPNRMRDANYQLNRDWNEDPGLRDWNDDGTVFCSQLVASGLQKIGVLDPIRPAANYTPHDLSNEEATTSLFLKRNAQFSRDHTRLLEAS